MDLLILIPIIASISVVVWNFSKPLPPGDFVDVLLCLLIRIACTITMILAVWGGFVFLLLFIAAGLNT